MRRIAICDDNPQDLNVLRQMTVAYLARHSLDFSVEIYSDGTTLMNALAAAPEQYVLLLLDILLGTENGVTLAKLLREQRIRSRLVFISNSPDFALEGYKVSADDYLIKPLDTKLFEQAMNRIFSLSTMITLKTTEGVHMIQSADILYIESDGHYITVVTETERLRSRRTLSELAESLGQNGFLRCQKGYLVNITRVSELRNSDLVLDCGKILPVGRQYHSEIEMRLAEYAFLRLPSLL